MANTIIVWVVIRYGIVELCPVIAHKIITI